MEISSLLRIPRGVTALIGGGGKTTLMFTMAEELRRRGSVIVCTSTRIRRPEGYAVLTGEDPEALGRALGREGVVCAGIPREEGKLGAPGISFPGLAAVADYVLTEADGSRGLPLKAHAPHEPAIPENAARTVLVLGLDGLGRPIREVCHRPELYAALAGAELSDPVTPELAARVIAAEGRGDFVYMNKMEDDEARRRAAALAALLPLPSAGGSLRRGEYLCLS